MEDGFLTGSNDDGETGSVGKGRRCMISVVGVGDGGVAIIEEGEVMLWFETRGGLGGGREESRQREDETKRQIKGSTLR